MFRWQRLRDGLAHAFAVRPEDPLSAADLALLDRIAAAVVCRQLQLPALLALESSRPLGRLAANTVHTLTPFLSLAVPPDQIDAATRLMQHPDAIDALADRLRADDPAPHA